MKSWIKARRSSIELSSARSGTKSQSSSKDNSKTFHSWISLSDSSTPRHVSGSVKNKGSTSEEEMKQNLSLMTPPADSQITKIIEQNSRSPETELLLSFSNKLTSSNEELETKRILIASEHYFRLVLECYDQLKALHYRASQEFSLAEWLHIHALLLYGRVQSVQKHLKMDSGLQHNQIDLSGNFLVFAPIATVLNAIGTVSDIESGLLYVPDAIFPQNFNQSNHGEYELPAIELQQILNGTLYDWQRSWHRVAEARSERESRATKFRLARSSSELISAIREATDSMNRVNSGPNQITSIQEANETLSDDDSDNTGDDGACNNSSQELDLRFHNLSETNLSDQERYLNQLFEEARNAKDYTIRPPCDRVYTDEMTSSLQPIDMDLLRPATEPTAGMDSHRKLTPVPKNYDFFTHSPVGEPDKLSDFTPLKLTECYIETQSISEEDFTDASDLLPGSESLRRLPSQTQIKAPQQATREHESNSNPPHRSVLRRPPPLRICNTQPFRTIPSPPNLSPSSSSSASLTSLPNMTPRPRVKIGGSSDLDLFVQYDSQLWQGYMKFIEALRKPNLARFASLKTSADGSYAWMIPVKVNHRSRNRLPTLQLPRESIPVQDQVLALILQTSHATPELLQSWHISKTAHVNMKQLLTDFIHVAVNERF